MSSMWLEDPPGCLRSYSRTLSWLEQYFLAKILPLKVTDQGIEIQISLQIQVSSKKILKIKSRKRLEYSFGSTADIAVES